MYRDAVPADCDAIYSLICGVEGTRLQYDAFACIFERQVADDSFECIIREEDGKPVGFINLRFGWQLHHAEKVALIEEFVVAPGQQRQGIGGSLFFHACDVARDHGCSQVEATCNQSRTDAHEFYERLGMRNHHYTFSMRLVGPAME
jgi:PhnO protein